MKFKPENFLKAIYIGYEWLYNNDTQESPVPYFAGSPANKNEPERRFRSHEYQYNQSRRTD